jgi:hypothetical protein
MSEIKKINKTLLILHTVPIFLLQFWLEMLPPTWFEIYAYPQEVLSTVENIILFLLIIPFGFLITLWIKSLFNIVIPIIFDVRKINFWEAYGIMLLTGLLSLN